MFCFLYLKATRYKSFYEYLTTIPTELVPIKEIKESQSITALTPSILVEAYEIQKWIDFHTQFDEFKNLIKKIDGKYQTVELKKSKIIFSKAHLTEIQNSINNQIFEQILKGE